MVINSPWTADFNTLMSTYEGDQLHHQLCYKITIQSHNTVPHHQGLAMECMNTSYHLSCMQAQSERERYTYKFNPASSCITGYIYIYIYIYIYTHTHT